jgi:hypothetical protein
MVLWLPQQAMAQERISVSAEVGGTARYFAQDQVGDPNAFGLEFGARTELNILAHLKADVRYSDGAIFSSQEFRQFDLSFSGSTPALLVFALDVHELYYRLGSRPGDDLFYLHTGLGIKGKVLGRLKASLGFTYIQDDGPLDMVDSTRALGAYAGVEHMVRSKSIDTNLRGAVFVAFQEGMPQLGVTADADLTAKFPLGTVFLGPRLDVAYRGLGLIPGDNFFAQRHEVTGHIGLALHWGSGL